MSTETDWIEHNGKPLPAEIADERQVEVEVGNGGKYVGTVGQFFWEQANPAWAIKQYRFL